MKIAEICNHDMHKRMKNIDWNHMRAFHATALTGSLSAAARRLGLTQPTLSRQVAALEAALGVALFERLGRRLTLSATGAELLEHIRPMAEAAQLVALAADGRVQEVSGQVSIAATDTYSAYILPAIIERIRREAPQLSIVVVASNERSDLHRRDADIAVRHIGPDRPGLIGQHLRDTEAHFYATDAWLTRNGMPARLADVPVTELVALSDAGRFAAFLEGLGAAVHPGDFRLLANSAVVIWEMVKRGMAVAPMLREIGERTPAVRRILPEVAPIRVPIWLITHAKLRSSPRIRLVHDILAEELARI